MAVTTPFDIVAWAQRSKELAIRSDALKEGDDDRAVRRAAADLVSEFVTAIGDYTLANVAVSAIKSNGGPALALTWPQERTAHLTEDTMKDYDEAPGEPEMKAFGLLMVRGIDVGEVEDRDDVERAVRAHYANDAAEVRAEYDSLVDATS